MGRVADGSRGIYREIRNDPVSLRSPSFTSFSLSLSLFPLAVVTPRSVLFIPFLLDSIPSCVASFLSRHFPPLFVIVSLSLFLSVVSPATEEIGRPCENAPRSRISTDALETKVSLSLVSDRSSFLSFYRTWPGQVRIGDPAARRRVLACRRSKKKKKNEKKPFALAAR